MVANNIRNEVESAERLVDDGVMTDAEYGQVVSALRRLVRNMADDFSSDNGRFDYGTFEEACGL